MRLNAEEVEIIAPNLKRRLSGVTSTIIQLIPMQKSRGDKIATIGPGLPEGFPRFKWWQLPGLWKRPKSRPVRIWHARRNIEMLAGLFLKHVLRMPFKVIFTSVAQRHHSAYTKWLIRKMDFVIAGSKRSGSYLEVPHHVINHGVDRVLFHPPQDPEDRFEASELPGKYAVGCFGRVRHQKGTDLFVDAMVQLLPQFPEWTALISGRVMPQHQAFLDDLKRKVASAGLSERIIFLGEVDDVKVWYRRLSLYVAPSRNEGFGLTPLEAMASQTAVVASDAGAYQEMIVPDKNGQITPAGDGNALTEAIKPYLADPTLAEKQSKFALSFVRENFALEGEAKNLAQVYDDIWNAQQL